MLLDPKLPTGDVIVSFRQRRSPHDVIAMISPLIKTGRVDVVRGEDVSLVVVTAVNNDLVAYTHDKE